MKMTRTCLILIICFSSLVRADPFDDRAISMETRLGLSLSCISTNVVLLQDQDVFCGRQWVEAGKTNRIAAVIGRVRSAPKAVKTVFLERGEIGTNFVSWAQLLQYDSAANAYSETVRLLVSNAMSIDCLASCYTVSTNVADICIEDHTGIPDSSDEVSRIIVMRGNLVLYGEGFTHIELINAAEQTLSIFSGNSPE